MSPGPIDQIDALRRERGLTQAALGERAGLTQARVSDLLRGRRDCNVRTLERLAEALDAEVVIEPRRATHRR